MTFTEYVLKKDSAFYSRIDKELSSYMGERNGCDNADCWLRYWLKQYGYRYSGGKRPHPQNTDGLKAWSLAEDYMKGVA